MKRLLVIVVAACGGDGAPKQDAAVIFEDADDDAFSGPPKDAPLPVCLTDMFDGAAIDPAKWTTVMRPSIALSQNAGLRFAFGDDGGTGVSMVTGVRSVEAVDMENKPLRVQILQAPTANSTLIRAELRAGTLALFKIELSRDADGLTTLACLAGNSTIYSGAYANETHVQIRFTLDEAFCETSTNGATFTNRGVLSAFAPVSVELGLVATVSGPVTGPGAAAFRQVTTCP